MISFHKCIPIFLLLIWSCLDRYAFANESLEGRFSFSLSTFDASGKLGQVERAMVAASLGTPIVAVIQEDRIWMAAPQILPSPFMQDDGTRRFSAVTQHIAIAHSGISADGRVLVAAAQQLAVEHAYTYDENIPIDLFLEELSLLFQEYTMTPGVRPFGATLLIAHTPPEEGLRPQLFRIDPSGSIVSYGADESVVFINTKFASSNTDVKSSLEKLSDRSNATMLEDRLELWRIIETVIGSKGATTPPRKTTSDDNSSALELRELVLPSSIITACLSRVDGLQIHRRKLLSENDDASS